MSPPLDVEIACSGCFLRERTGGTCPMVRDAYDPEAAETRRRAVALHHAIVRDAKTEIGLRELVQRDGLPAARPSIPLSLSAAANEPVSNDSRKEPSHATTA
jgi:hypothetical protein